MKKHELEKIVDERTYNQISETPNLEMEKWKSKDKVDTIILHLPKPLAGKGTARQLEQASFGMTDLMKTIDVFYIGPRIKNSSSLLSQPFEEVMPGKNNPEVFSKVYEALEKAVNRLYLKGKRHLGFACFGYVMFGTEALRRILNQFNKDKQHDEKLTAVAAVIDSAYPDTEEINFQLDGQGRPLSRFYNPGYISTEYLDTFFLMTSAYPFNLDILNARKPKGMTGSSIVTLPYTQDYINLLMDKGATPKEDAINLLKGKIIGFENIDTDDIIIPLLSSDIWDSNSIGKWMTEREYKTCTQGTLNIIKALAKVAYLLNKRVFLPIDESALNLIKSVKLENTFFGDKLSKLPALYICPYKDLPQEDHTIMIASSDIAIGRTGGQANATAVAMLSKKPYLVIDMPHYNYMQSYLTSLSMIRDIECDNDHELISRKKQIPYCWRGFWFWDENKIADTIMEMLTNYKESKRRADKAFDTLLNMYKNSHTNFFKIFQKLIGFED